MAKTIEDLKKVGIQSDIDAGLYAVATGDTSVLPKEPSSRVEEYLEYLAHNKPTGTITDQEKANIAKIPTLSSQLDENVQQMVNGDGRKGTIIAGVVRNTGSGWGIIDDIDHKPYNISEVSENISMKCLEITYPRGSKVGSLIATPDETFGINGLVCGTSVGRDFSRIFCYADLVGFIKGDGTVEVNSSLFRNTIVATKLPDESGFKLSYDGNGSADKSIPITSIYSDTTNVAILGNNDIRCRGISNTEFEIRAYCDFQGLIKCDGTNFILESNCLGNTTFEWSQSMGTLIVTHIPATGEDYTRFNTLNLTPFLNDSTSEIIYPVVILAERNKFRVGFYNKTGTRITGVPLKNMSFSFFKPDFKVPCKISKSSIVYFNVGKTIVRPSNMISNNGNLWIYGIQEP